MKSYGGDGMCKHQVNSDEGIVPFGYLVAIGESPNRRKCLKCGAIYMNGKWSDKVRWNENSR